MLPLTRRTRNRTGIDFPKFSEKASRPISCNAAYAAAYAQTQESDGHWFSRIFGKRIPASFVQRRVRCRVRAGPGIGRALIFQNFRKKLPGQFRATPRTLPRTPTPRNRTGIDFLEFSEKASRPVACNAAYAAVYADAQESDRH